MYSALPQGTPRPLVSQSLISGDFSEASRNIVRYPLEKTIRHGFKPKKVFISWPVTALGVQYLSTTVNFSQVSF